MVERVFCLVAFMSSYIGFTQALVQRCLISVFVLLAASHIHIGHIQCV
jgi:hypothetical protein